MHLSALTTSFGYGDFLRETARRNRGLFDSWLVATSPDDLETREVCRQLCLDTLLTQDHRQGQEPFNKGRAVQRGLELLRHDGMLLHVDADVILPPTFRQALESAHLDPECLYGCDRVMVRSWEAWKALRDSDYLQHDWHFRTNFPPGCQVGTRWCHPQHGYVPIGFFQLFSGKAVQWRGVTTRSYPGHHSDAARSDVAFGLLWDRRQRLLLPEVVAIHLESEPAKLGANWGGRTTKRFGPPGPAGQDGLDQSLSRDRGQAQSQAQGRSLSDLAVS